MTNKKVVGFFPCGHVGICNSCCAKTYKYRFVCGRNCRPYLLQTLPLPARVFTLSEFQTEEEYMNEIIRELTQPRYHRSMRCVFCKDKI